MMMTTPCFHVRLSTASSRWNNHSVTIKTTWTTHHKTEKTKAVVQPFHQNRYGRHNLAFKQLARTVPQLQFFEARDLELPLPTRSRLARHFHGGRSKQLQFTYLLLHTFETWHDEWSKCYIFAPEFFTKWKIFGPKFLLKWDWQNIFRQQEFFSDKLEFMKVHSCSCPEFLNTWAPRRNWLLSWIIAHLSPCHNWRHCYVTDADRLT